MDVLTADPDTDGRIGAIQLKVRIRRNLATEKVEEHLEVESVTGEVAGQPAVLGENVHFGLIGMVGFFTVAGVAGGLASMNSSPDQVEAIVKPFLATMGIFGTLVLLANFIWAYNLFRTCAGWEARSSS